MKKFVVTAPLLLALCGSIYGLNVPMFDFDPNRLGSGPSNLPSSFVMNGVTLTTLLQCDARAISGTSWPCAVGGTFSESGSGASPSAGQPGPHTEATARAVTFDAADGSGKGYALASTLGIGTNDVSFEFVFRTPLVNPAATRAIFSNVDQATGRGIGVYITSAGVLQAIADDDGAGVCTSSFQTLAPGTWYYVLLFFDRNSGFRSYVNGSNSSSIVTCNTAQGSIDQTGHDTTINLNETAPTSGGLGIAYLAVRSCPTCASSTTEMANTALARVGALQGISAVVATTPAPSTILRTTTKTCEIERDDDGIVRWFSLGNGLLCVSRRKEVSSSTRLNGYVSESQSTNVLPQSQTLTTTWTSITGADTITADQATDPRGYMVLESIDAATDGVGLEHGVQQSVAITTGSHAYSCVFKAGQRTWGWLNDATVANAKGWVNLSTCALGTQGAGVTRMSVDNLGGGLCRLSINFAGTNATHNIRLGASSADNVFTYTEGADATADAYFGDCQLEVYGYPTSYIPTVASSVTRNHDLLKLSAVGNAQILQGTMQVEWVLPNFNQTTATAQLVTLAQTSTTANQVNMVSTFNDVVSVTGNSNSVTQFTITGTSDSSNGNRRIARVVWRVNDARLFMDGVSEGTPDTSVAVPIVAFDQITIAQNRASITNESLDGMITRITVWGQFITP